MKFYYNNETNDIRFEKDDKTMIVFENKALELLKQLVDSIKKQKDFEMRRIK